MKKLLFLLVLLLPLGLMAQDINIVEPQTFEFTKAHFIHWFLAFLMLVLYQLNRINKIKTEEKKAGTWAFNWSKLFSENLMTWLMSIISMCAIMIFYNLAVEQANSIGIKFEGVPNWAKLLIYFSTIIVSCLAGWFNFGLIKKGFDRFEIKVKLNDETKTNDKL